MSRRTGLVSGAVNEANTEPIWCAMRHSLRSTFYTLGIIVVTSAAVGCSNHSATENEQGIPTGSASAQIPPASATPLAKADSYRKTRRPGPEATAISLTDITVSRQSDHDQAVLGFTGTAMPGWAVQYVDTPIQNGTGATLELPGQSRLEVLVLETPAPFTSSTGYTGPPVVFGNATPQIDTVQYSAQAAGITQVFVNLKGVKPAFTVSALSNPTRIVIDVAD